MTIKDLIEFLEIIYEAKGNIEYYFTDKIEDDDLAEDDYIKSLRHIVVGQTAYVKKLEREILFLFLDDITNHHDEYDVNNTKPHLRVIK